MLVGVVALLAVVSPSSLFAEGASLARTIPNPLIPNTTMPILASGAGFVPGMQFQSGGNTIPGAVLTDCLAVLNVTSGTITGNSFTLSATMPDGTSVAPIQVPVTTIPPSAGDILLRFQDIMDELYTAIVSCLSDDLHRTWAAMKASGSRSTRNQIGNAEIRRLTTLRTETVRFIDRQQMVFGSALPQRNRGVNQQRLATIASDSRQLDVRTISDGVEEVNDARNVHFTPLWDPSSTEGDAGFPEAGGTRVIKIRITIIGLHVVWAFPVRGEVFAANRGAVTVVHPPGHSVVQISVVDIIPRNGFLIAPGRRRYGDLKVIITKGCDNITYIQYKRRFAFFCFCAPPPPEPPPTPVPDFADPPVQNNEQNWTPDVGPPNPGGSTPASQLPRPGDPPFNRDSPHGNGWGGVHPDSLVDDPNLDGQDLDPLKAAAEAHGAHVHKLIATQEYLTIIFCDGVEIARVYYGHRFVKTWPCPGDPGVPQVSDTRLGPFTNVGAEQERFVLAVDPADRSRAELEAECE